MTTAAGSSNSLTILAAASRSRRLVLESSFPCNSLNCWPPDRSHARTMGILAAVRIDLPEAEKERFGQLAAPARLETSGPVRDRPVAAMAVGVSAVCVSALQA